MRSRQTAAPSWVPSSSSDGRIVAPVFPLSLLCRLRSRHSFGLVRIAFSTQLCPLNQLFGTARLIEVDHTTVQLFKDFTSALHCLVAFKHPLGVGDFSFGGCEAAILRLDYIRMQSAALAKAAFAGSFGLAEGP